MVKLTSPGPFLFKQKRMGRGKRLFTIYKVRTMAQGADKIKMNYQKLNEYKPPIFKIYNDPRYTRVGKHLAHSGLDELPQLINIMKGEMSFVGPRPLPVEEARKLPKKYNMRYYVLPGLVPPWVVDEGPSALTNDRWLEYEVGYVQDGNPIKDLNFMFKSIPKIIYMLKNLL